MNKLFSRYVFAILLASILMYSSCKKVYHSTAPIPTNYRLAGYTKITSPALLYYMPVVTEIYSFSYDGNNRLSQILYGSNDSNEYKVGLADLRMNFTYSGSYIYKKVTNLKSSSIVEMDTFNTNGAGQIITAEFTSGVWPIENHTYSYQGVLLDGETDVYSDSGTSISATSTFTSNNADLLYQYFNGTLTATFPDSGIRPDITAADTVRDTVLSYPIKVTWTTAPFDALPTVTTHTGVGSVTNPTDVLSGNYQNEITITGVDPNNVTVRPATFPSGLNASKFFQIYDYLTNRMGDYLQLESFSTYGVNVYQNAHMIKQMTTAFAADSVAYVIDGQSKVTQTNVQITDKYHNVTTIVYNISYETY